MSLEIRSSFLLILVLSSPVNPLTTRWALGQAANPASTIYQIAAGFSGGKAIASVQLSGTVERHTGTTADSGTINLTGRSDGSTQTQINLPGGQWTETQTAADAGRNCQWSGPDGVVHDSTSSSCWPAAVWFLPQISLQPAKLSPLLNVSSNGSETTTAGSFSVLQSQLEADSFAKDASTSARIRAQSMSLLFVDPTTMLPTLLDYTVHSDSGSALISVEVRFSNYQRMSGLMLPTHIERYLNGSLELEINVTQASTLN